MYKFFEDSAQIEEDAREEAGAGELGGGNPSTWSQAQDKLVAAWNKILALNPSGDCQHDLDAMGISASGVGSMLNVVQLNDGTQSQAPIGGLYSHTSDEYQTLADQGHLNAPIASYYFKPNSDTKAVAASPGSDLQYNTYTSIRLMLSAIRTDIMRLY